MEILMTSSIVSLVVHAVMSHRFGVITLSGLCLVDIEKKKIKVTENKNVFAKLASPNKLKGFLH